MNLGTLLKIEYTNLTEFIDAINRNFAVVQNSPLFKGIPGDEGIPGNEGISGERGSKFFFVDFVKFNLQFPTEVTLGSHIDLVFLNSKLTNPDSKLKILTAIDSPNLVDKDVLVLLDSTMISFNYAENKFYDTGKSLNTSITQEIQEIINDLFQSYLPQLQSGIKNVFENYSTLAKNYSDNNNTGISTNLNETSVYSPFIQGITSNIGINVPNHKYYGVSQNLNTEQNENTVVFGSIVKYYKLLMNTINTDGTQTLTSNYAPGNNNIPSAIFLQDTYNAGLLFGYKDKKNLKQFGSIFKNSSDELEIKSDAGKLISDSSSLKIHKNYMRYNKLVQFNDSLEISNNLFVGGQINTTNFKTGNFAYENNKDFLNTLYSEADLNQKNLISVSVPETSVKTTSELNGIIKDNNINKIYINHSNNIFLRATNYRGRVLVTNSDGLLSSYYTVENKIFTDYNSTIYTAPTEITTGVATDKFLTTYYYNYLVRKINMLFNTQINGLYWTKPEFENNAIPNLRLNNNLTVDKISNFGNIAEFNGTTNTINLKGNQLLVNTPQVIFNQFKNKILTSTSNGTLRNDVSIDYNTFGINSGIDIGTGDTQNVGFTKLNITANLFEVITKYHYNKLIDYLNSVNGGLNGNYWTKPDFESFAIPNLTLSNGLFSRKHFAVGTALTNDGFDGEYMNDSSLSFYTSSDTKETLMTGNITYLYSNYTRIKGFNSNQILGTGTNVNNYNGKPTINIIPINMIDSLNSITTSTYNNLNNQSTKTIADNKTIASLILGITTNYDNLKNYIDSQISILNQSLTNQINNLATDVYSKIQVINNDLNNIHNTLATKADIGWVSGNFQTIYANFDTLNNILDDKQNQINQINNILNTKVDKSVFEPWKAQVDAFMLNNIQFPKGGIILWEGKVINGQLQAAIPEGWEEVESMKGRVPVGWANGLNDTNFLDKWGNNPFSSINNYGGKSTHSLTSEENGPHTHTYTFDASGNDSDSRNEDWANGFNTNEKELRNRSNSSFNIKTSGLGTPHNNLQPYRVVIFIRAQRGA